jgi:hypothetical protein
VLRSGGVLDFDLSGSPDPSWGASPADAPPSYPDGGAPAVGFTTPSGATTLTVGRPSAVLLGVAPTGAGATVVRWSASGAGLAVMPASGRLVLGRGGRPRDRRSIGAAGGCTAAAPVSQSLTVTATTPGQYVLQVTLQSADGTTLPPVDLEVQVTG